VEVDQWEAGGGITAKFGDFVTVKMSPKIKGGFGTVSLMGTIVFSSESLSPTAQEQSRQMHSKVKRTDNAGNSTEPDG
jgi:hypothetical protein